MIDLTSLPCQSASGRLMDWGAILSPVLGGVRQRLNRLGTRSALDYATPPMRIEADGRRAIALLQQAKQQGGYVLYPQVDFDVGAPGSPTVDGSSAGGTTLAIAGGTAYYAVKQGQALNIVKSDRTYLYFAAAQTILDASGDGDVLLTTPLRTALAGGETVNLAAPVIAGDLTADLAWTLEMARTVGLSFSIEERA